LEFLCTSLFLTCTYLDKQVVPLLNSRAVRMLWTTKATGLPEFSVIYPWVILFVTSSINLYCWVL
jgi:hypothetical protein